MVKLFFTGIKHSGKTTQAKLAASLLSLPYADADDIILSRIDTTIREFYTEHGKEAFMKKELEAVREYIQNHQEFILSLGGGASDNTELMELMKNSGKIIYLKRNESEMLPVILKHGLPAFLDKDDIEGSFHKVYAKRDAIYTAMADFIVDLGPYRDKAATSEMLVEKLKENGYV